MTNNCGSICRFSTGLVLLESARICKSVQLGDVLFHNINSLQIMLESGRVVVGWWC